MLLQGQYDAVGDDGGENHPLKWSEDTVKENIDWDVKKEIQGQTELQHHFKHFQDQKYDVL